jgi:hypothetical protein
LYAITMMSGTARRLPLLASLLLTLPSGTAELATGVVYF